MTPLRIALLETLWSADRPMGAYDLKGLLSRKLGRTISATTVYRTLDFLCEQGVVARVESKNAYVACARAADEHASVLFVCDGCGISSEVENEKLERLLAADAKQLGFSVNHRVIELSGSCSACSVSSP
ncbi:MAG: Fur family transcriptional regulator [Pseudomonadota bacterium]